MPSGVLESLKLALLPRSVISREAFLASSTSTLLKEVVTSTVTYFGIAGAVVTLVHKFAPKWYMKLHRYTETRQILEYATPWPLIRSFTEMAIEYGLCHIAHSKIGWVKSTFPSPMHAYVAWNSIWGSMFFSNYWPMMSSTVLDRDYVKELVVKAPGIIIGLCMMPTGNDLCTSIKPFYEAAIGKNKQPIKRTITYESALLVCRSLIAYLTAETAAMVTESAWGRIGVQTIWFCVDIFAFRAILLPKLCDVAAPFEVDGQPMEYLENDTARPFDEDGEEEREARMMLMRITAEQMRVVTHFCYEIIMSEHCRGTVKTEAARLMRYATLLENGTSNEGVTDLEDVGRVASVYEHNEDELDTHGVDEEHRTCAVCLNEFEKSDKIATIRKCRHTFHFKCVEAWWAQHNSCPICRGELLREQSNEGEGGEEGGDAAERRRRQEEQRRNRAGGAGGAANEEEEAQQRANNEANAARDLQNRLFRGVNRCHADEPEWEWGPLRNLFYTVGRKKGLNAVRELQVFDPEQTMQTSSYDLWHVVIVNLLFQLPNWD